MRRTLGAVAVVAALVVTAAAWRADNPTLQGAWAVTSWELDGETIAAPQPGLIVFTETHYTMMYANTGDPRARYGDEMSDAEVIAAYRSFTANSGRYEVNGNELTTRAYVAKDPNYMGNWPQNAVTYTFRLEGETLYLQWPAGWPDERSGAFRRVEGQPAPW